MFFAFTGLVYTPLSSAADIRVRLINTQTGEPMAGQQVGLRPDRQPGDYRLTWTRMTTGADGVAVFHLADPAVEWVNVAVTSQMLWQCSPWQKSTFPTGEILEHGVVAKNRCALKGGQKGKIEAKAGEVVLFTRPLHWWEKAQ
jgi:hypothetical protein